MPDNILQFARHPLEMHLLAEMPAPVPRRVDGPSYGELATENAYLNVYIAELHVLLVDAQAEAAEKHDHRPAYILGLGLWALIGVLIWQFCR